MISQPSTSSLACKVEHCGLHLPHLELGAGGQGDVGQDEKAAHAGAQAQAPHRHGQAQHHQVYDDIEEGKDEESLAELLEPTAAAVEEEHGGSGSHWCWAAPSNINTCSPPPHHGAPVQTGALPPP